jgi:quinol monooxygenase YgiN
MSNIRTFFTTVLLAASSAMSMQAVAAVPEPDDLTVNVCAFMRAKPGMERELKRSLQQLGDATAHEDGSIAYAFYQSQDGGLFLHEIWESQALLDQHLKLPAVQEFVRRSADLLDGANEAHFGRLIASTGPFPDHAPQTPAAVHVCSVKHARQGQQQALRNALMALAEPTGTEPGLITYRVHQEADGTLFLYEAWRSHADLQAHFAKPYVKAFQNRVGHLASRNDVVIGRSVPAGP